MDKNVETPGTESGTSSAGVETNNNTQGETVPQESNEIINQNQKK